MAQEDLLRASCALLGLWSMLHAAQWLADLPRWATGSALGWDLQGLRAGIKGGSAVIAWLYESEGLKALAILLMFDGVMLLVLPIGWQTVAMLCLAWILIQLLAQRAIADAADKMASVVASGAVLQTLGTLISNQTLIQAGALWTGGQLTIAYFASGASKLVLRDWRTGAAPRAALSSYMWGNRFSARGIALPGAALTLAWMVMALEVLFPLALLLPTPGLEVVLGCFLLFHLTIALVMGLNSYVLAFLAAYPAAILLGQWLRQALGLA